MKKKARKPDAAERVAAEEYPLDKWSTAEEVDYANVRRRFLASRIRRAIKAAVRAAKESR